MVWPWVNITTWGTSRQPETGPDPAKPTGNEDPRLALVVPGRQGAGGQIRTQGRSELLARLEHQVGHVVLLPVGHRAQFSGRADRGQQAPVQVGHRREDLLADGQGQLARQPRPRLRRLLGLHSGHRLVAAVPGAACPGSRFHVLEAVQPVVEPLEGSTPFRWDRGRRRGSAQERTTRVTMRPSLSSRGATGKAGFRACTDFSPGAAHCFSDRSRKRNGPSSTGGASPFGGSPAPSRASTCLVATSEISTAASHKPERCIVTSCKQPSPASTYSFLPYPGFMAKTRTLAA